jgi:hypothetical protein
MIAALWSIEREGVIPTVLVARCEPGPRVGHAVLVVSPDSRWTGCSRQRHYPTIRSHNNQLGRQCLSNSPRRPREDHTPVLKNKVAKAPRKSKCIRQKSSQVWYPEHQHTSCGIDPVTEVFAMSRDDKELIRSLC